MQLLPNILLVTANETVRKECENAITPMHWPLRVEASGHDALCHLESPDQCIDVLILDLVLSDMDGIALANEITRKHSSIKRIMIAESPEREDLLRAINKGHVQNLFTLPVQRTQLHEAVLHAYKTKQQDDERKAQEGKLQDKYKDLKVRSKNLKDKAQLIQSRNRNLSQSLHSRTQELEQTSLFIDAAQMDLSHAYNQAVHALSRLLEIHLRKQGRGKKIAELAIVMAHDLDLPTFEIQQTGYAALLAEACKVVLNDKMISKSVKEMSKQERERYEKYPLIAQSALNPVEHLQPAAKFLRNIEENYDGTGFPDHLKGHMIPLPSRIIRVIRDYLALINGDAEGVELDQAQALATLHLTAGYHYDAELLEKLASLLERRAKNSVPVALQIDGLQPGMVIAHDFFTQHHVLLLAKGTQLDSDLIDKIISYQQDSGEVLILPIDKSSLSM